MIKLSGLSVEETAKIIPPQTILLGYVGSISHGTQIPKDNPDSIDDIDIMGTCVGPLNSYIGLQKFEQKIVQQNEWDSVVYELTKFVRLLLKFNPNVIGLLWLDETKYIHVDDRGKMLIENRDIFSSKRAYKAFVGYAKAQLHKMEHAACEGYMGQKRKELVKRFGYDTKNAAHCIRLMRMGIEFLTTGHLNVFRHDRDELKNIKRGEWSLEKVKGEAERLFQLADEAFVRTDLPAEPNTVWAEQLIMSIIESTYYK